MLVHLSVRDLALIDSLELALEPGLVAVTGETGAGKSILMGALSLLLGGRAKADIIRTGCAEAEVAGQFALSGRLRARMDALLGELGLPCTEEGALLVRRVVSRAGRHKQFVNGALATVAQLKEVAEPLVDITGQHAHQALLRAGLQRDLLDAFGEHDEDTAGVGALYREAKALLDEQRTLSSSESEKLQKVEYLRYQLEEIEALGPTPGEDEALAQERSRLMNTERFKDAVAGALELLVEGDDALSRVQAAARALGKVGGDDGELASLTGILEEAAALIDDVGRTLSRRSGSFEQDPARLADVDDRLDALKKLMRKHGADLGGVLELAERMREELDGIEHSEERLGQVEQRLSAKVRELGAACDRLGGKRRAAARLLARRVQEELRDLGMPAATLEVRVEPLLAVADTPLADGSGEARRALSEHGADRVELLLSANAGEPQKPLGQVASGGELSRVLLAIKRVLLAADPVPLSVFDEVDAGVGGAVGEAIGAKLRAIAEGRQVLCVTHLGPIAAQAHHHLRVEKQTVGERTLTTVRPLDHAERVEEIARMIGGRKLTDTTRSHAAEMLRQHDGPVLAAPPKKRGARRAPVAGAL
jgi:DNA repair protein RecN (Recombination protein N)